MNLHGEEKKNHQNNVIGKGKKLFIAFDVLTQ